MLLKFLFRLPFTYSLGEGEFEKLKGDKDEIAKAREDPNKDCDVGQCRARKAHYCLKVADFMVGFARAGSSLMPMLTLGINSHF